MRRKTRTLRASGPEWNPLPAMRVGPWFRQPMVGRMTAETRKIRPYDVAAAAEPSDTREFGTSGLDAGPAALAGAASPFNDNARETSAISQPPDEAFDDEEDEEDLAFSADASVQNPAPARRRGPLVTRWIGFAAQRRRAQARVSRMRDRQV